MLLPILFGLTRCEQRRNDKMIGPMPKRLTFTATPVGEIEAPNSPSDLDRYDVQIVPNLTITKSVDVFRAMAGAPEQRQAIGTIPSGAAIFVDHGVKVDAQYRYSFLYEGAAAPLPGQDPAIQDVVVEIPRDVAITSDFDISEHETTMKVGRLFLGKNAKINTRGLKVQIFANELISQEGALIYLQEPQTSEVGPLEIWVKQGRGDLSIAPDYPKELLTSAPQLTTEMSASAAAGTQEVSVHVASHTSSLSVIPVLGKPPQEPKQRGKWASYQRPFVVQIGTSRQVVCAGKLVSTEEYSGVYARPVPGRDDPFYYLITPTHGQLATLSAIDPPDPGKTGLTSVGWSVHAMGPMECPEPSKIIFPFFGDPKSPYAPSFAPVARLKGTEPNLPMLIKTIVKEIHYTEALDRLMAVEGLSAELDVPEWAGEVGYSEEQAELLRVLSENPSTLSSYLNRHHLKAIHFTPTRHASILERNATLYLPPFPAISPQIFLDTLAKDSLPVTYAR